MNINSIVKTGVVVLVVLMISSFAFARSGGKYGRGEGRQGNYARGMDNNNSSYGGQNDCSHFSELSEADQQRVKEEGEKFSAATDALRREIYQKRLEIRSELAKETIDKDTIIALQQTLSEVRAKLDQERIEHILRLKEIDPDLGQGFLKKGKGNRQGGKRDFSSRQRGKFHRSQRLN